MTRRLVPIILVFALLLTLFAPFSTKVIAATESIALLSVESNDKGIQLQWQTTSSADEEERFTILKNNEELAQSTVEQFESTTDQDESLQKSYQLVDQQVVQGETYTYTVKSTDNLQTQPITVTFEPEEKVIETIDLKLSNVTDESLKLTWTEIEKADAYQILIDGKVITQLQQAGSYDIKDLKSQTSYKISVRAITEESILTEAVKDVTTAPGEKPEKAELGNDVEPVEEEGQRLATTKVVDEIVTIPDQKLKRAIKKALKLDRDELYLSDLQGLTTLDASHLDIKDITGLEKATNLTNLNLAGNEIKNATALKPLSKLDHLDLSYFQGTDLGFVSSLTHVKTLILADSMIESIESISALSKLEVLNISFSEVRDLAPLSKLSSLKELDISYLDFATLTPIKELKNLETLSLYGERYFDLKEEVIALEREGLVINHDDAYNIYITSIKANEERAIINWEYEGKEDVDYYRVTVANKVTNIDPDESGESLTVNSLAENTEYNLEIVAYNESNKQVGIATTIFKTLPSPKNSEKVVFKDERLEKAIKAEFGLDRDLVVSDMKTLEYLYLDNKKIKDLTGLEEASNLQSLSLSGNNISDLTPLATLQKLNYLIVEDNPIANFDGIKNLTNLEVLTLGATGFRDLSLLENLQNLTDLYLDQNELTSLEKMPNLEKLTSVSLHTNNIESMNGIEKLNQLHYLDLDNNPLKSIVGIQQLAMLRDLNLSGTSLDTIDALLELEQLETVSIYENKNLLLTGDSPAFNVVKQLEKSGVYVHYEGSEDEEWFEAYILAVTENSLQLYWDYYGEQDIAKVEVFLNGKKQATLASDENELKIDNLKPNTMYSLEVKAYNNEGEVILTSIVEETTWTNPTGEKISFKDHNLKELIKEQLGIERDPQVSDMGRLHSLYISESMIKDLTGLEYAENLFDISLTNNSHTLDLTPLQDLPELFYMEIIESPIKDYSILKSFTQLNSLNITNNNLSDLSFLSGMKRLEEINLSNNDLTDISVLSSLKKLNSVNLANNKIDDLSPLRGHVNLFSLDVSGNPIDDISSLIELENLYELILDETKVTDLSPLLEIPNLEYVSLFNLDLSGNPNNAIIIAQLIEDGVRVNTEVNNDPELYIDEVTEDTISISWDPMLPKGTGTYYVNLYSADGEEQIEEIQVDSHKTSYQFTGLSPYTDYYFDVYVDEDEYNNYLSGEATTLPVEGSVKDVSMYVYRTKDVPEVDVMFDLYGIDEATETIHYFGGSDEQGQLIDYSSEEPLSTFELLVGSYEISFMTEDEEEVTFQFEINGEEDYLKYPLAFLLEEDDQSPVTPPANGEEKDEEGPKDQSPSIGEKPTNPVKVDAKPIKVETVPAKQANELPKTATVMYNLLMAGILVLLMGGAFLVYTKRRNKKTI